MKHLFLLLIGFALLSGCATPTDPNVTKGHAWHGGAISMEARKLDDVTYTIEAEGAGACSVDQVTRAWIEMADKVAAGRKYSKETSVSTYEYDAPGPFMTTHHVGQKVSGKIVLH
jgi:hypothetical protein